MIDPIVDEVRRVRDEHAARFNYDLHAIFLDVKKREKERGLHFVDGVAHQPMSNQALPPLGVANSGSQGVQPTTAPPVVEL